MRAIFSVPAVEFPKGTLTLGKEAMQGKIFIGYRDPRGIPQSLDFEKMEMPERYFTVRLKPHVRALKKLKGEAKDVHPIIDYQLRVLGLEPSYGSKFRDYLVLTSVPANEHGVPKTDGLEKEESIIILSESAYKKLAKQMIVRVAKPLEGRPLFQGSPEELTVALNLPNSDLSLAIDNIVRSGVLDAQEISMAIEHANQTNNPLFAERVNRSRHLNPADEIDNALERPVINRAPRKIKDEGRTP